MPASKPEILEALPDPPAGPAEDQQGPRPGDGVSAYHLLLCGGQNQSSARALGPSTSLFQAQLHKALVVGSLIGSDISDTQSSDGKPHPKVTMRRGGCHMPWPSSQAGPSTLLHPEPRLHCHLSPRLVSNVLVLDLA